MRLILGQFFSRYLVPTVTLQAHCVNLVTPERDVRRRRTYVFIVGVRGAQTVAMNTANVLTQVDFTDLLFDKTHVAHIAGGICAERINLAARLAWIRLKAIGGRRTA
jgi:hypothetical protein